ncbi:MAG: repeat containing protein [Acidobacteriaceae bacterium]|nr:repeat containing protein [Acidobacteriaceae bacterium]
MGHPSTTHPSLPTRLLLWMAFALLLSPQIHAQSSTITTIVASAILPSALVFDSAGNLYLAETGNHHILKVDLQGHVSTFAGTGTQGFSGDKGPAAQAQLDSPQGLALTANALYIADTHNHRIRRVDLASNLITTVAGIGTPGFSGDTGLATAATLNLPTALALDAQSNLYFADTANHRIRRIDAATATITTVAGNGTQGYSGDSGSATNASIDSPSGLAVDTLGNLYLADTHNHRIRKIAAATNVITTLAGIGTPGSSPDQLALPQGIIVDATGNLYVADTANHRLLRVDATTHILTTLAGTGTQGYAGDSGPATAAMLDSPRAATVAPNAQLTLADTHNNRVRQLSVASTLAPTVTTLSILDPSATPITVTTQTTSATVGVVTGSVTLLDAASPIATATLAATGATTIVLPTLATGTHSLTASYAGDRNFQPSTSSAVSLTILPTTTPTADFTLTANAPNAQTIPAGTIATFAFTTQTQGSLASAINLAVSGLPVGATATFSPTYLPPGPAANTFTLTITTLKPSTNLAAMMLPAIFAVFLLPLLKRRGHRIIPTLFAIALVSLVTLATTSCGDRISKADTQAATVSSYAITVTGTATSATGSALVHTAVVSLTLQ